MGTRLRHIRIPTGDRSIAGTLVAPNTMVPGALLVHGWDGSQEQYLARAHAIAALGCICLTIDLRGHASDKEHRDTVTREDKQDFQNGISIKELSQKLGRHEGSIKMRLQKHFGEDVVA